MQVPYASEAHIGQLGGHTARISTSFTRPADTTAYAFGDLVANDTVAASVVPLTFTAIGRDTTKGGMIRRVRLRKSGTSIVNAAFRLHLFSVLPVPASGDNAALVSTGAATYVGWIDISATQAWSDGAAGFGAPAVGSEINFTAANYYGLLEARGTYTPISAETFEIQLEVIQN